VPGNVTVAWHFFCLFPTAVWIVFKFTGTASLGARPAA